MPTNDWNNQDCSTPSSATVGIKLAYNPSEIKYLKYYLHGFCDSEKYPLVLSNHAANLPSHLDDINALL
jgi:hypothetical protein